VNVDDYTFREADENDFRSISEFLTDLDFGPKKPDWLRWKYLANPHGRAQFFVIESPHKRIKGLLGFEPRLCRGESAEPFTMMQAVDGIASPELRGKHVYTKLLKTAMEAIDAPLLGFPSKSAERTHLRTGWKVLAPEQRWYFPAAMGRLVAQTPLGFLVPLINLLSRGYAAVWLGQQRDGLEMKPVERFERGFPVESGCLCGIRTAEFLNWRYIDNPMKQYYAHEFTDKGETIGYCVYASDKLSVEIFDFMVSRHERACYQKLVKHFYETGFSHILFRGLGLRLGRFGFVRRLSRVNYIAHNFPKGRRRITLGDSDW